MRHEELALVDPGNKQALVYKLDPALNRSISTMPFILAATGGCLRLLTGAPARPVTSYNYAPSRTGVPDSRTRRGSTMAYLQLQ